VVQEATIAKLTELALGLAAKANHGSDLPAEAPKPAPVLRVVKGDHPAA
jgi:hypothetical protein